MSTSMETISEDSPTEFRNEAMTVIEEHEESKEEKKESKYDDFYVKAQVPTPGRITSDRQSALNVLLSHRSEKTDLVKRFIIKRDSKEARDAILGRGAKLGALLSKRPSKKRLQEINVIKNSVDEDITELKNIESKRRDQLSLKLERRPDRQALLKSQILQTDEYRNSKEKVSNEKRTHLDGFLAQRPKPEILITQKIITDIGDLPSLSKRTSDSIQLTPLLVESLKAIKVKKVRCGWGHTCIIDEKGSAYAFGNNSNGQLGIGDDKKCQSFYSSPQLIDALKEKGSVSHIDCGDNHSVAIVDGTLYTWGMGSWGRLGNGKQDDVFVPTVVEISNERAKWGSCGAYHTLLLTESGKVYGFGWNKAGRVGVGKDFPSVTVDTPHLIKGLNTKVQWLSAGAGTSIVVDEKGKVYSWGSGAWGNLGHGDENDVFEPKLIESLKDKTISRAVVGASHSLALAISGEVYSWGSNHDKQLGRSTDSKNANTLPGLINIDGKKITHLSAGKAHSSLVFDGSAYSWGKGAGGVLGHGDETTVIAPKPIEALKGKKIRQIACGWIHTAALTEEGQIFTFGTKEFGKLGY